MRVRRFLASGIASALTSTICLSEARATSEPFWAAISCSTTGRGCSNTIKVPRANHWIIQTASGLCTQTTTGGNAIFEYYLATTASDKGGAVFFVPGPASSIYGGIAQGFLASGSPLAYADPGSGITFQAIQVVSTPLDCTVYLTGQATTP